MTLSLNSINILKKHQLDYDQDMFNNNKLRHEISLENDIILEAKSLLLKEQCDKLANRSLSEPININGSISCKSDENTLHSEDLHTQFLGKTVNNSPIQLQDLNLVCETKDRDTLSLYFNNWKEVAFSHRNVENVKFVEKKIIGFLDQLEDKQKTDLSKELHRKEQQIKTLHDIKRLNETTCYTKRFQAQKNIISKQKERLESQQKIIEELKLNRIREDVDKSLEQSKYEIHNIFKGCSNKLKCQIGKIIEVPTASEELTTVQVPKRVKQMEQRAQEREINRQVIKERRKVQDEKRLRLAQDIVERKRAQDEEETRKNLEVIKERRRVELEKEKLRQRNREKYEATCKIVDSFCERKLKKTMFNDWKKLMSVKEHNELRAEFFCDEKLMKMCFNALLEYSKELTAIATEKALKLCNRKLKIRYFTEWKLFYKGRVASFQVAHDLYDFRLESRFFIYWHRYVCAQQMKELKLLRKAKLHYNRKIKFHYFYQWRSLQTVLILEKAKEEKKRKWREKVLEIIPDYEPPIDD